MMALKCNAWSLPAQSASDVPVEGSLPWLCTWLCTLSKKGAPPGAVCMLACGPSCHSRADQTRVEPHLLVQIHMCETGSGSFIQLFAKTHVTFVCKARQNHS